MKSITINDVEYKVGDTVFLVPNCGASWKNPPKRCVIEKITPSGYTYMRQNLPQIGAYETSEWRIDKNGEYKFYCIAPYTEELNTQLEGIVFKKAYIQTTFKRLKLVKTLNYDASVKINEVLDEIGIDKVEE